MNRQPREVSADLVALFRRVYSRGHATARIAAMPTATDAEIEYWTILAVDWATAHEISIGDVWGESEDDAAATLADEMADTPTAAELAEWYIRIPATPRRSEAEALADTLAEDDAATLADAMAEPQPNPTQPVGPTVADWEAYAAYWPQESRP